jgi:hypothetical protein
MIPHYLRFARAVALVSVALPVPVLAGECLSACVGGPGGPEQTSSSGSSGSSGSGTSGGGTSSGEPVVVTTGVVGAPPHDAGIVSPPGVRVCPSPCDAGGNGGPALGLPELPETWDLPRSVPA